MAQKVVLIADSETGTLVDVAGNGRENGRYYKFAKRMLSTDTNPVLDFGANGGTSLAIECNGGSGDSITLRAQTVSVTGDLKVGGKLTSGNASEAAGSLSNLRGTEGEIDVKTVTETAEDGTVTDVVKLSLDSGVAAQLELMGGVAGGVSQYVRKSDIAEAIEDLVVDDEDTLEDVKGTLRVLLARLGALAADESEGA